SEGPLAPSSSGSSRLPISVAAVRDHPPLRRESFRGRFRLPKPRSRMRAENLLRRDWTGPAGGRVLAMSLALLALTGIACTTPRSLRISDGGGGAGTGDAGAGRAGAGGPVGGRGGGAAAGKDGGAGIGGSTPDGGLPDGGGGCTPTAK